MVLTRHDMHTSERVCPVQLGWGGTGDWNSSMTNTGKSLGEEHY